MTQRPNNDDIGTDVIEREDLKNEKYSHIKDWSDDVIKLAIELHNTYEVFSKQEGWETQKSTHLKMFKYLPIENQRVMLRLADLILNNRKEREKELFDEFEKIIQDIRENEYMIKTTHDVEDTKGIERSLKILDKIKQELQRLRGEE
jgi:hypothetical protein